VMAAYQGDERLLVAVLQAFEQFSVRVFRYPRQLIASSFGVFSTSARRYALPADSPGDDNAADRRQGPAGAHAELVNRSCTASLHVKELPARRDRGVHGTWVGGGLPKQ
jgi:hypothetical protein